MGVFNVDGQDEGNSNEYRYDICVSGLADIKKHITDFESIAIASIQDAASAGMVKDFATIAKAQLLQTIDNIDTALIEWSKANNIKSCDIGGNKRLVFSQPKKNRFDTQAIYEALGVSQELQDILPRNPQFSVTAVRINEKIAHLTWEEPSDKVEIKPSIVDKRYIKGHDVS